MRCVVQRTRRGSRRRPARSSSIIGRRRHGRPAGWFLRNEELTSVNRTTRGRLTSTRLRDLAGPLHAIESGYIQGDQKGLRVSRALKLQAIVVA